MSRNIKIAVKTTYQFLQVFNGILELTDKELQVLSNFIDMGEPNCAPATKKRYHKLCKANTPNNHASG